MSNPIADRDRGDSPSTVPLRSVESAPTTEEDLDRAAVTTVYGSNVLDPDALRRAVAVAEQTLAHQSAEALTSAKTPDEVQEDIARAREFRKAERAQDTLDHDVEIERRVADRERRRKDYSARDAHQAELEAKQRTWEQASADADAERRRLLDPLAELTNAYRARRLPWMALIPAGVALLVSAANLATQGARVIDAPAAIGTSMGAGLDAVFTIGLLALLLGRMSGAVAAPARPSEESVATRRHRSSRFRSRGMAYLTGDLGLGICLALASYGAHQLPSADGTPHNGSLGLWFLLLPFAFAFSSIYAPMLREDAAERFRRAAQQAEQQQRAAHLQQPTGLFGVDQAQFFRLLRWLAEEDRENRIPGERDPNTGLPSASGVMKHVKAEFGEIDRFSKPKAQELVHAYGVLLGAH